MTLNHKFLATFVAAIWGFNYVAGKFGVGVFPPIFFASIRYFAIAPLILFIPRPQVPWKYLLGLAFLWGGLQFVLTNIGFSLGVSAGLASLISQVSLFFCVIYSVVLFGEKTTPYHWAGMIIGF